MANPEEKTGSRCCADFLISDERFGEPVWDKEMPRRATKASVEMLQPVREALMKKGFFTKEITGVKPWGGGIKVGKWQASVSIILFPIADPDKQRWEGTMRVGSFPSLWLRLPGIRNRAKGQRSVEKVTEELKQILREIKNLTGIRWISLKECCSSKGYKEAKEEGK
jgi:hypothetical protein